MSFLERAKAAATDLAAKADQAMNNAWIAGPAPGGMGQPGAAGPREADAALRDYGLMVWREQHGQPVDATAKEQVLAVLRRLEGAGQMAALRVGAGAPPAPAGGLFGGPTSAPPPPPPGAAAAAQAPQPSPPMPPPPVAAPTYEPPPTPAPPVPVPAESAPLAAPPSMPPPAVPTPEPVPDAVPSPSAQPPEAPPPPPPPSWA